MMKNPMYSLVLSLILLVALICSPVLCTATDIKPVTVGQPMPDFTLPRYQGGDLTLSTLKGKNVLMIFPRGLSGKTTWCAIDNYKYAELMDIEKKDQIRKNYNLEILYIFPYDKMTVDKWVKENPKQLDKIEAWKNPPESNESGKKPNNEVKERFRTLFPKNLKMEDKEVPTPFPILIDADRKLSNGLGIFSTEWGGSKVDQCMSSVYIVDKDGNLLFKYIGQNPFDRPTFDYLLKIIRMSTD